MMQTLSKAETARTLHAAGRTVEEISRATGMRASKVLAALSRKPIAANGGARRPNTIELDPAIVKAFQPHAVRREISVSELALQLLTVIAVENLVDGVLDDASDRRAA